MSIFYETLSCRYFISTKEIIRSIWEELMHDRKNKLTVNEFYDCLDHENLTKLLVLDQCWWNPGEHFEDCVEFIPSGEIGMMILHNYHTF